MRALPVLLLLFSALTLWAGDFQFVVYSDVQGGGGANHAKLPGIISRLPGGAVCAVGCGDLAGLGNYDTANTTTWDEILSVTRTMSVPFWPARGNHDGVEDAEGRTLAAWRETMSFVRDRPEYRSGSPNNDYYSFMHDSCLFVVLNNMNGTKAAETTWIAAEARSDRARNAAHIFVFLHYAMLSPNQPDSVQANYRWEKYITPYFENLPNLSGVFWGDRHWFWKGDYKGKVGVLLPPTTPPRAIESEPGPGELAGSFSGYVVVHVKGDSVLAKAYDYSEAERASFVMKSYNPYDKMPVIKVVGVPSASQVERFLKVRVAVAVTYQDTLNHSGTPVDTTYEAVYRSIDSSIASVDSAGWVTGLAVGVARIEVSKRGIADTVMLTVTPSLATVDSIRISPDSVSLLAGDTVRFNALGYFHSGTVYFSRAVEVEASWNPADTSVASSAAGLLIGKKAGGPVALVVAFGGVSDTAWVQVLPKPDFLVRVNFKTDTVPHAAGWSADNGRLYSASRGIGWLTSTSTTARNDRNGGILLGTFVAKSVVTDFKINAPDGNYILKIGVGDNKYGGISTVTHQGKVLVSHEAVANAIIVDTVTVSGGAGIVLSVYGKICYLVAISKQGIPVEMVADDGGLALIAPVPPSTAADVSGELNEDRIWVTPNPFNPVVRVDFSGVFREDVKKLFILNSKGCKVHEIILNGGVRAYEWKPVCVAAGYYLVNVKSFKKSAIIKVLFIK